MPTNTFNKFNGKTNATAVCLEVALRGTKRYATSSFSEKDPSSRDPIWYYEVGVVISGETGKVRYYTGQSNIDGSMALRLSWDKYPHDSAIHLEENYFFKFNNTFLYSVLEAVKLNPLK